MFSLSRLPLLFFKLMVKITSIFSSYRFLRIAWHNIFSLSHHFLASWNLYTAISRKVVEKSARNNPERYCGWFWVHCCSKKFERMAREAMDACLRVLNESNKSRFDGYCIRNSVLIISHVTFRDCSGHIFSDNLSRNGCILCVAESKSKCSFTA